MSISTSCDWTENKKIKAVLTRMGLSECHKISDSLQGSVWRARASTPHDHDSPQSVVIKVAHRSLHQRGIGKFNVRVQENILREARILKFVAKCKDTPASIIRSQDMFSTRSMYLLLMEDGGSSFFDFVVNAHKLIRTGNLAICEWKRVCQLIARQMLECIAYLQSKDIIHYDVSLENFVINEVFVDEYVYGKGSKTRIHFVTKDIQVKLTDFASFFPRYLRGIHFTGLAEMFVGEPDVRCVSNKWCGKPNYKSPEVVSRKKGFDAKQNDIWCFGVTLFMMMVGVGPWQQADESDVLYVKMTNGCIKQVLQEWKLLCLVDDAALDLLQKIFVCEEKRISVSEMKVHPFFCGSIA